MREGRFLDVATTFAGTVGELRAAWGTERAENATERADRDRLINRLSGTND